MAPQVEMISNGVPACIESAAVADTISSKVKVLVAEGLWWCGCICYVNSFPDNTLNYLITKKMLASAGFECHQATNGYEVLQQLAQGQYTLILMDCNMPRLDGYATTKMIRGCSNLPASFSGERRGSMCAGGERRGSVQADFSACSGRRASILAIQPGIPVIAMTGKTSIEGFECSNTYVYDSKCNERRQRKMSYGGHGRLYQVEDFALFNCSNTNPLAVNHSKNNNLLRLYKNGSTDSRLYHQQHKLQLPTPLLPNRH